ncbi:MAG: rhodanese-like domain-containing protein [Clostridiales bacterium]|nr:rhodanese-like domain-containing protein [Clostridiales bacterium]
MKRVTIKDLLRGNITGIVIDMRSQKDYNKGTFPGAIHIDASGIRESREILPKDRPLCFLCYTGDESDELAYELGEEGYDAYSIAGGYREYLRYQLQNMPACAAMETPPRENSADIPPERRGCPRPTIKDWGKTRRGQLALTRWKRPLAKARRQLAPAMQKTLRVWLPQQSAVLLKSFGGNSGAGLRRRCRNMS